MFGKLITLLFLLVLAQAANALPILKTDNYISTTPISNPQSEQQTVSVFDDYESENLFNLPSLNRLSSLLFTTERQTTPNYVLVIEFF